MTYSLSSRLFTRILLSVLMIFPQNVESAQSCPNDCGLNGFCVNVKNNCVEGEICDRQCKCYPGWSGYDCDTPLEFCSEKLAYSPDDATVCFNGGKCVEFVPDKENDPTNIGIRCDCTTAILKDRAYAGHQCEHQAQNSCEKGFEHSFYAFCVNGGRCNDLVEPGEPHPLCGCPEEYEGRHCQFQAGSLPHQEQIYQPVGNVADVACPNDCGPNGFCVNDTSNCVEGETCDRQCKCFPDWSGSDCGTPLEFCPEKLAFSPDDATVCFNGGKCVEFMPDMKNDPTNIGVRCDCTTAVLKDRAYAGHQCEHQAQNSCEKGFEHSYYAFCVNDGRCKDLVEPGEPHPLCDCPEGYEGRHCQFQAGSLPYQEQIYQPVGNVADNDNSRKAASVFFGVLLAFALVLFLSCLYRWRRRNNATKSSQSDKTAQETMPNDGNDQSEDDFQVESFESNYENEII